MDFGMPTLMELDSLEETLALCEALGLHFVELNMNMPQYQVGAVSAQALKASKRSDIYYTIHLDENLNVWDFNPLVAQAYLDTVKNTISLARELEMPVVNMHMNNGIYLTLPGQRVFLFDKYRNAYRSSTERFCRECEQAVGNSGVLICIENCGGFTDFQREAIEYLLESPVFALTMDIGHSHAAGDCDEPFLLAHEDRLRHMHVHDALGAKNHLAVGTGEIDIRGRLDLARRHGCRCVLETKTVEGLRLSVENLKRSYMAVDGM